MSYSAAVSVYPPYPYPLAILRSEDVDRANRLVTNFLGFDSQPFQSALASIAGEEVQATKPFPEVLPLRAWVTERLEPFAAVLIAPKGAPAKRVLIVPPANLVSHVLQRALGAEHGDDALGRRLTEGERGVLFFLAGKLLREALPSYQVLSVLTSAEAALASVLPSLGDAATSCETLSTTLTIGERRGVVRALRPAGASFEADQRESGIPNLALTISVDSGRAQLRFSELMRIEPGDRIAPVETFSALRLRAVGGGKTTWWCERAGRDDLRVERIENGPATYSAALPFYESLKMSEQNEVVTANARRAALEAVGDAPIELSIEVARIRLTLDQLAMVESGTILRTGDIPSARALLRAGDRIVAEGELVNIEGELGLRLHKTYETE